MHALDAVRTHTCVSLRVVQAHAAFARTHSAMHIYAHVCMHVYAHFYTHVQAQAAFASTHCARHLVRRHWTIAWCDGYRVDAIVLRQRVCTRF